MKTMTMNQRLHDFWFEPAPAERLALLRILVGAFSVWYFGIMEPDVFARIARTDPKLWAPVGIVFGDPISPKVFTWIFDATILAAVCFTIGLWHRITGPIAAILITWMYCFQDSWSMIFHSMNLVALHTIILGFTRSADALSVDAFLRNRRAGSDATATSQLHWRYGWPIKLMIAVTVSAYLVTAIAKLSGPLGLSWATGRAMRSQMAVDAIRKEILGKAPGVLCYSIYDWLPLFTVMAAGSLVLELFAPLGLFYKRVGRLWAINAFLMHWGILFVMNITFEYQLTGIIFAAFFRVERLLNGPRRLWYWFAASSPTVAAPAVPVTQSPSSIPRATLYYDGECGLCDRFVQFVLRHDRHEYFQFATLQSPMGREQLARLGLSTKDLQTVVLVEDGQAFARSTASLRVCRRLAGPWSLFYAFIVVPQRWRDGVYAFVAERRKLWFKPPAECPVMPPEWRRRFVS